MKQSLLTLGVALALAGCGMAGGRSAEAPGPATASTGLVPQKDRITDGRILRDRETLDMVQQRLRKLNESGIPQNNYSLAKAQCWLDTAESQYHENDRTGYIEESLAESMKIVQSLEADRNAKAGYDTPLVARSTKLRDDLWGQLAQHKSQASTLACNARTVACAEVRLVRAGHAEEQTGWRQAVPHVQMAEDALRRAGIEAASCPQPTAPVVARAAEPAPVQTAPVQPAVVPVPVPVVTEKKVIKEMFVIHADTAFRFDRSGKVDLLPGGLEKLQSAAMRLKSYKSIETLVITGHTDRLGTDAHNDKLAQARANTIRAWFEGEGGVKAESIIARGVGKREPVTGNACRSKMGFKELVECLQPDRRVTIEVTGQSR